MKTLSTQVIALVKIAQKQDVKVTEQKPLLKELEADLRALNCPHINRELDYTLSKRNKPAYHDAIANLSTWIAPAEEAAAEQAAAEQAAAEEAEQTEKAGIQNAIEHFNHDRIETAHATAYRVQDGGYVAVYNYDPTVDLTCYHLYSIRKDGTVKHLDGHAQSGYQKGDMTTFKGTIQIATPRFSKLVEDLNGTEYEQTAQGVERQISDSDETTTQDGLQPMSERVCFSYLLQQIAAHHQGATLDQLLDAIHAKEAQKAVTNFGVGKHANTERNAMILDLLKAGRTPTQIAKAGFCSRRQVYQVKQEAEQAGTFTN